MLPMPQSIRVNLVFRGALLWPYMYFFFEFDHWKHIKDESAIRFHQHILTSTGNGGLHLGNISPDWTICYEEWRGYGELMCTPLYEAFAQLDKSPESKGWSEKVQPTPVMGWSKEILQS